VQLELFETRLIQIPGKAPSILYITINCLPQFQQQILD